MAKIVITLEDTEDEKLKAKVEGDYGGLNQDPLTNAQFLGFQIDIMITKYLADLEG